jgi:hypothetical protein
MLRMLMLFSIVGLLLSGMAIAAGEAEAGNDTDTEKDKEHKGWFDPALFHDSQDGQFDISNWLASRHGFIPVPIVITGPTLGAGGGLNLMFLHGGLTGPPAPSSAGRPAP